MPASPGRACPLSYRYAPGAFAGAPALRADTLWIAGGLYGNRYALAALLEAQAAEPGDKALVFNGDFHWFDALAAEFELIDEAVAGFPAIRGNVETEIADPAAGAGCGCAYPDWVGDATVDHSNAIIERLRAAARTSGRDLQRLSALPMHLVAEVGGERIGIVHGDAESLAGWNFSQEVLATPAGLAEAERQLARAGVRVFASSHTCLPVLKAFPGGRALINNGAAGMPNFRGERYGIATRISTTPSRAALYGTRCGAAYVEAVALPYDAAAWEKRFLELWPAGTDAHRSYFERIRSGPAFELAA
ncbi:MAG: metallophosphoesterase family protein [Burkholderiales bacterium]